MKIKSKFKEIDKKWIRWARGVNKNVSLASHVLYFSLFSFIGIIIYLLIYIFILPQKLPLGNTSAVNWLVLHQHSLILDYIRFAVFVTVIPLTIIGGWFVILWKKEK
jgi:hypothetical protein